MSPENTVYVQAIIDVAALDNFPIHQNDNALLVVEPSITFTRGVEKVPQQ